MVSDKLGAIQTASFPGFNPLPHAGVTGISKKYPQDTRRIERPNSLSDCWIVVIKIICTRASPNISSKCGQRRNFRTQKKSVPRRKERDLNAKAKALQITGVFPFGHIRDWRQRGLSGTRFANGCDRPFALRGYWINSATCAVSHVLGPGIPSDIAEAG